jgi:hypothetical protein
VVRSVPQESRVVHTAGEFGGPGPTPPSWRALLEAREQLTHAGPGQAPDMREVA